MQLCCNAAERRRKVTAHFASFGVPDVTAEKLADDAIQRFDAMLATGLGEMFKQAAEHAKKQAD